MKGNNGQIAAAFIDNAVTLKEELNSIRIIGRAVAHLRKL